MAHADGHTHHITPTRTLVAVFAGLVVLTIVTVAMSRVHLGPLNVPIALAIAAAKGTLVVLFFMALKYDNRVNMVILTVGALFVVVFLAFTLLDTQFRGDLPNTTKGTIMDQAREEEALKAREPDPESIRINRPDTP
jgi:cytochrome c oxidase subunit 4